MATWSDPDNRKSKLTYWITPMTIEERNKKSLARTYIGVAIDEALSEEIKNPLIEAMELLEDEDFDSVASLLDDVNESCYDQVVKRHINKATGYLSELC